MRDLRSVLVVALLPIVTVTGCSSKTPPARAPVAAGGTVGSNAARDDHAVTGAGGVDRPDAIPRVVRRILSEEKDLVSRSLLLAVDLPDPRGRQRALNEANELASELAQIEAPLDGADSDRLDAIVTKLLRIDTRVALLHEALRTATSHTTAVLVE